MVTKIICIATHDGTGNQTPIEGVSKWVPGTILGVYDIASIDTFLWGDMAGFLFIKVSTTTLDKSLLEAIQERKKRFNWQLYVSAATMLKYLANYKDMLKIYEDEQELKLSLMLGTTLGQQIKAIWDNRPGNWEENKKAYYTLINLYWEHGENDIISGMNKIKDFAPLLLSRGINLKKLVNKIVLGRDNKIWREKFEAEGQKPKWNTTLDLDLYPDPETGSILNTPSWQYIKEDEAEI